MSTFLLKLRVEWGKMELGGRDILELVYELVLHGKLERPCELELEQRNLHMRHQQHIQYSDQQCISHFDVYHQEVKRSSAR